MQRNWCRCPPLLHLPPVSCPSVPSVPLGLQVSLMTFQFSSCLLLFLSVLFLSSDVSDWFFIKNQRIKILRFAVAVLVKSFIKATLLLLLRSFMSVSLARWGVNTGSDHHRIIFCSLLQNFKRQRLDGLRHRST